MPALLVPEVAWGPASFGVSHANTVRAQAWFGEHETGFGYWGFSPASTPDGGYSEWGGRADRAGAVRVSVRR